MSKVLTSNSVALAGEFAVLCQLALRGFVANLTLGHTKHIDILVADPNPGGRMLKQEVKTNYRSSRSNGTRSRNFGNFADSWMMGEKHEDINDASLFYCFVSISKDTKNFKFFIVPSSIVASYVKREHQHWLDAKEKRKDNKIRIFRLGRAGEKYPIKTPKVEEYEDNWDFKVAT